MNKFSSGLRLAFLLIVSIATYSSLAAQTKIYGCVTDNYGDPISNALIKITNINFPSAYFTTSTDNTGNYTLSIDKVSPKGSITDASIRVDKLSQQILLSFNLGKASYINVKIIDLSGRSPLSILSQQCQAGYNNIAWNYTPYREYIENKVVILNFQSNEDSYTTRFIIDSHVRNDFYAELISQDATLSTEDLENSPYTAEISGSDFSTHIINHLTLNATQPTNFIINKQSWIPFKCGEALIGQYDGNSYQPIYIKGVNLGAGIPGTSPAEMAPTAEQYAKWFQLISDAGFNLIRVYTLHYPRFYEELNKFNQNHRSNPIYIIHGAWLDEEYTGYESTPDLYSSTITYNPDVNLGNNLVTTTVTNYFDDRIKEVIDVVHGNAHLPERWGWASGHYTTDVSPWLLGYIIGREIYSSEVIYTNKNNPSITSYEGSIFQLHNCSATEAWATSRLDHAISYEQANYKQQHPISFSSWPTLDPINHPTESGPEDTVAINLDPIDETNSLAGYFASYHVYPYFPDFIVCDPDYREYQDNMGENSYLGYLYDLKSQYLHRPLIISEYGVSSSWGSSRFSTNSMHHGGLTEKQQGDYIIRMTQNIYDAGCGGGMYFSWIDEWFKYVWIFGQTTNAATRNRWHNVYNAEQNYGLITFIPQEPDFSKFAYKSKSEDIDNAQVTSDIEGIYININMKEKFTENDTLWLGIDTYNAGKGESILPNKSTVNNRAEFCVCINEKESTLFVTKAYNLFGIGQTGYPTSGQYFRSIPTDGAGWKPIMWKNHRDDNFCAGSVFDASQLKIRDNKSPIRHDAVIIKDKTITIKLPWAIINFNDPSSRQVVHITDYSISGGNSNQTETSDGVAFTVIYKQSKFSLPRYIWDNWDEYHMPKTLEYRKNSYYMIQNMLNNFPEN